MSISSTTYMVYIYSQNVCKNYMLVNSLLEIQNVVVTTSLRMTNRLLSKLKSKVSHEDY